jgi:hypothetical protein
MIKNIEISINNYLKTCQFAIKLDKSVSPTNETLLLSYMRFIKKNKKLESIKSLHTLHIIIKNKININKYSHYLNFG